MWKLIFLGLLIWLAIHILKRVAGQSGASPTKHTENKNKSEDMVQCSACAVHLPKSEAFLVKDNFYCCQAHIKK